MIVELVGPGGAGKTTVEPLVSVGLGIAYHPARKRHGRDGQPLTWFGVWWERAVSVARKPSLFYSSLRAHRGSPRQRVRFALDMCRRHRIASYAARSGGGVVASGAVHALCAASANTDTDLTHLIRFMPAADVYVRLIGEPSELTRRLADRQAVEPPELADHADIQKQYERYADAILEALGTPVVEVDVDGAPEDVAARIVSAIGEATRQVR